MRKPLKITIALVAAVGAVSAIAMAAGGRHHFRHGGGEFGDDFGGGGRHALKRLVKADADKDGAVTLQEFLSKRDDRFAKLDKNADGSLDADEITATLQERADHRTRMMLARLDANGDGKVTREEAAEMRGKHGWGRGGRGHGWHDGERGHGPGKGWGRGSRGDADDDRADLMDDDGDDVAAAPATGEATAGQPGASGTAAAASDAAKVEAPKIEAPRADGPEVRGPGDERGRGWRHGWRGERQGRMFERMDANGDGVIDKSDLDARSGEAIAYAKKQRMHVLDKDRDGKVSRDEFNARPKQRFVDLDLDGDGKITGADLPPRMAERWQKRTGGDAGSGEKR